MTRSTEGFKYFCSLLPPSRGKRKGSTAWLPDSASGGYVSRLLLSHPDDHQVSYRKLALAMCLKHRCQDG